MAGLATLALAVDLAAGEPPAELHPTIWMGRWLTVGREHRISRKPFPSFIEGALLVGSGALVSASIAAVVESVVASSPSATATPLRGLALKPALSVRALLEAAARVQRALERNQLDEARELLGRDLVSRDTRDLSSSEVAGAAIESVAENFGDSVVAPLLAFRVGGLTGAYFYRMLNTADAMLGYRTTELEWFGKAAARADDALNIVPARLAAALVACAAPVGGGSSPDAFVVALSDSRRTTSPNAGWPMAAMAGALGVRLTKRNHYALNDGGREPLPGDIARSCKIVLAGSVLAALLADIT